MLLKDMLNGRSDWQTIANRLMEKVSPDFMIENLKIIAGGLAHPTGSKAAYALADQIAASWKLWGVPYVKKQEFFATIPMAPSKDTNEVTLVNSVNGSILDANLQCTSSTRCSFDLPESKNDPRLSAYQAYSKSGTATGSFVYLNYATPRDLIMFDEAQGREEGEPSILCNPKLISIARLGCGTRQSKIRALLQHCNCGPQGEPVSGHHPAALVLYPDPVDIVPSSQPIYPDGPGLPGDAPVLGHVCMSLVGGGNPGTPYLPSSDHVYEEDVLVPEAALTPLLVQPIGYDQAIAILSHLSGPVIPRSWQGCSAQRIGPSTDYHLRVSVRNTTSPGPVRCVNVIGVIPADKSSEEADQYVILGNHHDAWFQGACDPGSGTILLQQLAKVLGNAYIEGFRPRRTIILGSWDGEEFSLLGSTHFAEALRSELTRRAVTYLNADCPIKGHMQFNARTDPLIADALIHVSHMVLVDPPTNGGTMYEEWLAQGTSKDNEPKVSLPGGGSDHIPFAYKLGIPSSYPEYVPDYGMYNMPMYHTRYDVIDVVERFLDPPSSTGPLPRHRLLSRFWIALVIYLTCATRLPYSPNRLVRWLREEWNGIQKYAWKQRTDWTKRGVRFEWISDELEQFSTAVVTFETLATQWENSDQKFPTQLNCILAGLPQQFVAYHPYCKTPFGNVLLGPSGYQSASYPLVRSALHHYCTHPQEENLITLKRTLSVLATCFQRATLWLGNGLLGLDALQPPSVCPDPT